MQASSTDDTPTTNVVGPSFAEDLEEWRQDFYNLRTNLEQKTYTALVGGVTTAIQHLLQYDFQETKASLANYGSLTDFTVATLVQPMVNGKTVPLVRFGRLFLPIIAEALSLQSADFRLTSYHLVAALELYTLITSCAYDTDIEDEELLALQAVLIAKDLTGIELSKLTFQEIYSKYGGSIDYIEETGLEREFGICLLLCYLISLIDHINGSITQLNCDIRPIVEALHSLHNGEKAIADTIADMGY